MLQTSDLKVVEICWWLIKNEFEKSSKEFEKSLESERCKQIGMWLQLRPPQNQSVVWQIAEHLSFNFLNEASLFGSIRKFFEKFSKNSNN